MDAMLADFRALHESLHAENARLKADLAQAREALLAIRMVSGRLNR